MALGAIILLGFSGTWLWHSTADLRRECAYICQYFPASKVPGLDKPPDAVVARLCNLETELQKFNEDFFCGCVPCPSRMSCPLEMGFRQGGKSLWFRSQEKFDGCGIHEAGVEFAVYLHEGGRLSVKFFP